MDRQEEQYLKQTMEVIHANLAAVTEKMGDNAKDMESMNEYFWENYAEFDEYGYEMYDNKQAMKTRLSQQETYAKERSRYQKMLDTPYFGRVDFCYEGDEEPEIYYIGIGNLAKERAAQPLIFDWRAPVSGLFYDYDKGPAQFTAPMGVLTGEITRKRQYKIRGGRLVYVLENEINIDDEILQQALSEQADAKLKSIVTTIQKEQNSIIRDTSHRILVVQGCAGSGKTSVALHRIAYLLYHNRETLRAAQILVLSPNGIFGDYISHILPELGEENVCEMTFDDYAYRELRAFGEAEERCDELERALHGQERTEAVYKQTRDFVRELDAFILSLEWEAVELKDFSYKKISLTEDEISAFFYEKLCDVPIFSRMDKIAEYVIDALETLQDKDMEEEEQLLIHEKLRKMYCTTNCLDLYNLFLLESGREDQQITDGTIPYDDVYPLLYLKYATEGMTRHRMVKHLVIDEMQDYSYLQYRILQKMFDCPMTILGDRMQTMAEQQQDVMPFLWKIFGKEIHYVEMKKSYRSTMEITAFANRIFEKKQETESVTRHGEAVQIQKTAEETEMYDAIAEQLRNQEDWHTSAVLCMDADSSSHACEELKKRGIEAALIHRDSAKFTAGISVMPFYLAKGLEFDAVFLPDVQTYQTPLQKQALYINTTRALHVLRVFEVNEDGNEKSTVNFSTAENG